MAAAAVWIQLSGPAFHVAALPRCMAALVVPAARAAPVVSAVRAAAAPHTGAKAGQSETRSLSAVPPQHVV